MDSVSAGADPSAFTKIHPCHSWISGSDQRVVGLVEPFQIAEPWRRTERTVELVDPGVIRALDGAHVPRRAGLQELVAPVSAGVVEPPKVPVEVANDEDTFVPDPEGLLVAWLPSSSVLPTHTHPASKKCSTSQSKTACEVYASAGSVRAKPNVGASTGRSSSGAIGHSTGMVRVPPLDGAKVGCVADDIRRRQNLNGRSSAGSHASTLPISLRTMRLTAGQRIRPEDHQPGRRLRPWSSL